MQENEKLAVRVALVNAANAVCDFFLSCPQVGLHFLVFHYDCVSMKDSDCCTLHMSF